MNWHLSRVIERILWASLVLLVWGARDYLPPLLNDEGLQAIKTDLEVCEIRVAEAKERKHECDVLLEKYFNTCPTLKNLGVAPKTTLDNYRRFFCTENGSSE